MGPIEDLSLFESRLKEALRLDLPYRERAPRAGQAPAAVLVLFAEALDGALSVLLIRRTESVQAHKGQMAFPGGMCEPDEIAGSRFVDTALRETEEEVGISPARVRVIGELPDLCTTTGFTIYPIVGILDAKLEEVPFRINPAEIDHALWIPLRVLLHENTYRREMFQVGSMRYPIHVYQVGEYRIWGATGAMIKNLLDRLRGLG